MKKLIETISSYNRLSLESTEAIKVQFVEETFSKNSFLLQEEQTSRKLYFLEKGIVRTNYYHDGREITSWFYMERQFFTSRFGFWTQQPSAENIEAAEDAVVYSIDYHAYQKLNAEHHDFCNFSRLLAQEQVAGIALFSKGFSFMSAKEKYDMFIETFPNVANRVNLGHIASFLGIGQETLSRIRRRK